jgi:O-antigen ligase
VSWAPAALIVATVAFDPWGWASFGPVKWALVTTLTAVSVAVLLMRPALLLHVPSALAWTGFLAWGVVASVFAVDSFHTWFGTPDRHLGLVAWVCFGALFVVGQNVSTRPNPTVVLRAATAAALLIGGYVLLELVDAAPVELTLGTSRAGGPFGSPAYLGAACALLVPLVIGYGFEASGPWRWAAAAGAGVGLVAAVASQTRAGWVGLLAAGFVSAPAWFGWMRRRWRVAAAAVAMLAVLIAATPVGSRIGDLAEGSGRGRIDEWQVGAAALVAHPIVGAGFEGYRIVFPDHVDADYERRYTRRVMPDRAHNGILDVGVTAGLPGAAVYVAGAVWLVGRSIRAARTRRPWLVGLGAAVAGYAVQQQFLFPLAEIDGVFWLLAGVLIAATGPDQLTRLRTLRGVWIVPLIVAGAAAAWGTFDVVADHRAGAALDECCTRGTEMPLRDAEAAMDLRPDSIRYPVVAASIAASDGSAAGLAVAADYLDRALDMSPRDQTLRAERAAIRLDLARATRDTSLLAATVADWESLVADDPYNARNRLELGLAYAVAGRSDDAEAQWLVALDLAPRSTAPAANLAGLYLDQGRRAEAEAMVDVVRSIDPEAAALAELEARLTVP